MIKFKGLFAIIFLFQISIFSHSYASSFYAKNHMVRDLANNIIWLRCSVGQQWNGEECIGDIILMDHQTIEMAIAMANEQLGGEWRLPNLEELFSLVCQECKRGEKYFKKTFPNTAPRAYWTGERNELVKRSYWTVNFFTGHKYGRFFPEQKMAVRLVKDR